VLRFFGNVGQLRDTRLHSERHFILTDPRRNCRILYSLIEHAVQGLDGIHNVSLLFGIDTARVRDVVNRIAGRMELNALKLTWKKPTMPLPCCDRLVLSAARGGEDDVTRQIFILTPKSVEQPRTHARSAGDCSASVHEGMCRIVVNLLGFQGAHNTNIVGETSNMWKRRTHLLP